jgi:hypothetical protein
MPILELLKNIALWLIACAILFLSSIEFWSGRSVTVVCLGILAAAIVFPPVRKRLHRGIRYFLTPKASAWIVVVMLITQVVVTAIGASALDDAQKAARLEQFKEIGAARRQARTDDFKAHKSAILAAIDEHMKAGDLTAALAETNKYSNADSDLDTMRRRINAIVARKSLEDESSLTLEQRAVAYTHLAESEPENKKYADEARTLNAQLVVERDKPVKHAQLLAQFSAWNGSHRNVEAAIKASMNNPDSYQHVETRFTETPDGAIIYSKFRGTNAFGGIITTMAVATVDREGNVTALHF